MATYSSKRQGAGRKIVASVLSTLLAKVETCRKPKDP